MRRLADRARNLSTSGTATARNLAASLSAQGLAIANFAAGELNTDTSDVVKRAAIAAIEQGKNRYTEARGIEPLRTRIAERISATTRQSWDPSEVVVTAGGKQALFNTAMVLFGPGDEVIVPAPYWTTFPEQIRLVGATPIFVNTKTDGYQVTAAAIAERLTARTRGIVLNTPNNPTGAVCEEDTLRAIAAIAVQRELFLIFDECYGGLIYPPARHVNPIELVPAVRNQTIIINSFSKSHALTGWRLGYLAAPLDIAKAAGAFQSHSTSNACVLAQYGVLASLEKPDLAFHAEIYSRLARYRQSGMAILKQAKHARVRAPDGGFYFYLDVAPAIGKVWGANPIGSIDDLAQLLLAEAHAAVVSGTAFGDPAGIRISFAVAEHELLPGLERIVQVLDRLQ